MAIDSADSLGCCYVCRDDLTPDSSREVWTPGYSEQPEIILICDDPICADEEDVFLHKPSLVICAACHEQMWVSRDKPCCANCGDSLVSEGEAQP